MYTPRATLASDSLVVFLAASTSVPLALKSSTSAALARVTVLPSQPMVLSSASTLLTPVSPLSSSS